jgi:hypothetical protein
LLLCRLTASARRLALVGLAKNTGKTVALATLLRECEADGRAVGVTSVGRDGEERDVIDFRIEKPRVNVCGGTLLATTDGLLRASGLPHDLLEQTDVRTPLGRVVIARLRGRGAVEVAGPSAAADVRRVSDAMLAYGAEQVLIDGAIDRRAASSPDVADGLVISTGAVLSQDIAEVVAKTADAIALVRLQNVAAGSELERRLQPLAGRTALLAVDGEPVELGRQFVLTADAAGIASLLDANPQARWMTIGGALPESFLAGAAEAARRRRRELVLVVADSTKVFLSERGPQWYARQGAHLQTRRQISLRAITVNPVAPQSHSFDSEELRGLLAEAVSDVPIFDVLHPEYGGSEAIRPPARPRAGA